MKELISRWAEKSLSQIMTFLAGIIFLIAIINKYTVINIKTDYFGFFPIKNTNPTSNELLAMSILIVIFFISYYISMHPGRFFPKSIINDEEKSEKALLFSNTIVDIINLFASFSCLSLSLIIQSGKRLDTDLTFLIYIVIIMKILFAVYNHFYYKNEYYFDLFRNKKNHNQ